MRLTSRKFIIAILLVLAVLLLNYMIIQALPAMQLVGVVPALMGFSGIVLGAVAVMYPASNAFQTSKWSKSDES